MVGILKTRWLWGSAGAVVVLMSSAACVQFGPRVAPAVLQRFGSNSIIEQQRAAVDAAEEAGQARPTGTQAGGVAAGAALAGNPAAAVPAAGASGRRTDAVRRGPISEVLAVSGRVAGEEEVALNFPKADRIESIAVRVGDVVEKGQLLLQMESRDIARELASARQRLEGEVARLEQVQQQAQLLAQARQRESARRLAEAARAKQAAVAEAETRLRAAQAELEKVRAGAPLGERRAAQEAVVAARAAVARAEADQVKPAQANLVDALAAERDLASAHIALARAQAELERLNRQPDPQEVRAAEREIERAKNALRAAEATKEDEKTATGGREVAVANARLTLQEAQDRLERLKHPPTPSSWDTEGAKQNVTVAQLGVEIARNRLETVRKGPDQATNDAAAAAVASARLALANAEVRLAEVEGRPAAGELQEAEGKVAAAQAALERVRAESDAVVEDPDGSAAEIAALRRTIEQAREQVTALERDLAATRLTAPFAGTVTLLQGRVGDMADVSSPAVVLTKPGEAFVRIQLTGQDAGRVAAGQKGTIQSEMLGRRAKPVNATVASISDVVAGGLRVALLSVEWPEVVPPLGTAVDAALTLQVKENALLVSEKAIRSAGARRFVDYMDGNTRRVADVQVGIVSGGFAEVLGGLREGQVVLVGP